MGIVYIGQNGYSVNEHTHRILFFERAAVEERCTNEEPFRIHFDTAKVYSNGGQKQHKWGNIVLLGVRMNLSGLLRADGKRYTPSSIRTAVLIRKVCDLIAGLKLPHKESAILCAARTLEIRR